jgi:hypothetical protein
MLRSLLPSILASLGFVIISLAKSMTLFEWKISEIATDFPPTYQVHILPSPWTTRVGDSLDDDLYISFGRVYVSTEGASCRSEDLNFIIRRSQKDEALERVALNFTEQNSQWLYEWGARVIILSGIYIWWFTIFYERRSIFLALLFSVIAGVFYVTLTQIVRPLLPRVVPLEYLGTLECYRGTVTFNAGLSKIHFETVLVFFAGILLELGAVGIMVRQIIKAVIERKESSKSAAG